jgi:competence protein ComEC
LRKEAFAEDCVTSAVVVSRYQAPPGCAAHALVIDGEHLDAYGAHAVTLDGGGYRVTTAFPEIRRPFMPPRLDQ